MGKLTFYMAKGMRILLHPSAKKNCRIDRTSKVCSGSQLNHVSMDRYSYIGHDCFLNNVSIGPFCSLADGCKIGGAQHQMSYVSTSPVFTEGKNILNANFSMHPDTPDLPTIIGADVWIGMGTIIKGGINIGAGAVIGAGSVLTKDVPPYEIWAGNPAKFIRKRFQESVISKLEQIRWWDWDDERIWEGASHFNDVERFVEVTCFNSTKNDFPEHD